LPPCNPSTKRPRGEASQVVIEENVQGVLFASERRRLGRPTWVLLIRAAVGGVQAEVSLPKEISCDGEVVAWYERIILGLVDGPEVAGTIAPANARQPFEVKPVAK
jgi:hypothetical protein